MGTSTPPSFPNGLVPLHTGPLPARAVSATWDSASRPRGNVEDATLADEIAARFAVLAADAKREDRVLFDGPCVRLCSWRVEATIASAPARDRLVLALASDAYRYKAVTMALDREHTASVKPSALQQAMQRQRFDQTLAVAIVIETADGAIPLFRRGLRVGAAGHWHVIAGHPEPALVPHQKAPPDLAAEMLRELHEEIAVDASEIAELRYLGLVSHTSTAGRTLPEVVFGATLTLDGPALLERSSTGRDAYEHDGRKLLPATPDALTAALASQHLDGIPILPIGAAALWLHGYAKHWW